MAGILILGGSGFIGNALYKELSPFFNVHATYNSENTVFEKNQLFHQWNFEQEDVHVLLDALKPKVIVSAVRGNPQALVHLHQRIASWVLKNESKIVFLSSANVFDRFTNYPSYENDKTLSESLYGLQKIKTENLLLRLPPQKAVVCRIPMIFGRKSPRVIELKNLIEFKQPIEVFPNVVLNATHIDKLVQQLHYIINRRRRGIFHLGSSDLVHHTDLIQDICKSISGGEIPLIKQVYDSNEDRYLAVLPKDNLLPKHLQLTIEEVVYACG